MQGRRNPAFPPEVFLTIVAWVSRDDRATLQSCALVSTVWCMLTQPFLFEFVILDHQDDSRVTGLIEAYDSSMARHQSIAGHVRWLALTFDLPCTDVSPLQLSLYDFIRACSALNVFHIWFTDNNDGYQATQVSTEHMQVFRSLPAATRVTVTMVDATSFLPQLLSLWPRITHLSLQIEEPLAEHNFLHMHFGQLRELKFWKDWGHEHVADALIQFNNSPIEVLQIRADLRERGKDALLRFIPTLRHLSLDMHLCSDEIIVSHGFLDQFPHLRRLDFDAANIDVDNLPASVRHISFSGSVDELRLASHKQLRCVTLFYYQLSQYSSFPRRLESTRDRLSALGFEVDCRPFPEIGDDFVPSGTTL